MSFDDGRQGTRSVLVKSTEHRTGTINTRFTKQPSPDPELPLSSHFLFLSSSSVSTLRAALSPPSPPLELRPFSFSPPPLSLPLLSSESSSRPLLYPFLPVLSVALYAHFIAARSSIAVNSFFQDLFDEIHERDVARGAQGRGRGRGRGRGDVAACLPLNRPRLAVEPNG